MGATLLACSGESVEPPNTLQPPPAAGSGAPVCTGAICSCQPTQERCGGLCANLSNDANNCGACGLTCNGGACDNGRCACPSTLTACLGSCVDTITDARNCGQCGFSCGNGELCEAGVCMKQCTPACVGGQMCVQGACACPAGRDFCGGMCVDLLSTPQHCGACGKACIPGQLCQQSACVCPTGQTTCDNQCVDLQISPQHCGACGEACDDGETCMAGICRAPAGADGCTGEPRDLSLGEVAAYQSIKVPLVKNGTAVSEADRVSGFVQNRLTLFRVAVTTGNGFAPREFSARVTVTNGNGEDQYFAKQRITKSSTDEDSASTFQVFVPADKILEGTKYRVEVVECGGGGTTAPGGAMTPGDVTSPPATGASSPHFPASGDAELGAVDTGTLKIKLIPIRANNMVADTSEMALGKYRDYILAMYPLAKIEFTVGDEIASGSQIDWNDLIEEIRAKRQSDRPADDIYYYGLLRPTATFEEYCRRGCTAGVGFVGSATQAGTRAALGVGFADEMSAITMAHEVGHNHGRNHAPCANGGSIQGVDREYPYEGAETGVWGFDSRSKKLLSPTETTDIMGYCDPKWISDYTYNGLFERLVTINSDPSPFLVTDPEAALQVSQRYNVLLNDAKGPRWSQPFPEPDAPHGIPESADVFDLAGELIDQVTVYRTKIGDAEGASSVLIPEVQPGWHAIKLIDALPLPFSAPITIPAP